MSDQEWVSTAQACQALGLTPYKLRERMKRGNLKRYRLPSRDMRMRFIKAEDVERIRKALSQAEEDKPERKAS